MTVLLPIALVAWIGLLPALVVGLRLRRAVVLEVRAAAPPTPPTVRLVGNSAHACQGTRS